MRPKKLSMGAGVALTLILTAQVFPANVHVPPLGFHTVDITPDKWSELKPEYKFKGKVGDTLRFEQIQDIYVIRCFMHVGSREQIAKTVEDAIPADAEFLSGAIPEKLWARKRAGPAHGGVHNPKRRGRPDEYLSASDDHRDELPLRSSG